MQTTVIVMRGPDGQIQRIYGGNLTGADTAEMVGRHVAILNASGFRVVSTRTINEARRRWALIFVAEAGGR